MPFCWPAFACCPARPLLQTTQTPYRRADYIAADPTEDDVIFTQEDLLILDAAEDYGATATGARTSGLITSATLKFAMNSNTMTISGLTKCVSGVKKCGFTKVVVMRRLNASYTWSPYKTYKDLYRDGTTYSLSKKLVVNPGWYLLWLRACIMPKERPVYPKNHFRNRR